MVEKFKKILFPLFLLIVIAFFYAPFLLFGKIPIPADTLVGLYHPYRDFYSREYPRGIPFKNFLITDPVRQTYIWKELSIDLLKRLEMPLWNPYEMAGKPLAGNIQSSPYYPLNVVFAILPMSIGWGVFIFSQTILSSIFTYLYLRNLKLNNAASAFGAIAFSFSGFVVAWLTWGNVVHTALWLPLVLLGIDKITSNSKYKKAWIFLLAFGLSSALLAGHTQTFLYIFFLSFLYFLLRWRKNAKNFIIYILICLGVGIVTFIQWYPSLMFLANSARGTDRQFLDVEGWFIPWKHLVQFLSPDFFGNPATLNYFGIFNYAEFVGYIGVLPILFAFLALVKRNNTINFFVGVVLFCLVFSLPTGLSSIPYLLSVPIISSLQPTRLIFLICFGLSILSAYGLNTIMHEKLRIKNLLFPAIFLAFCYVTLLLFAIFPNSSFFEHAQQAKIALRNLVLPLALFLMGVVCIFSIVLIKNRNIKMFLVIVLFALTSFDLTRFAQKFTPFTSSAYLYPSTKTLEFLKSKQNIFRVAVMDRRILAPNFLTHYKIQTIEGYDPLYLNAYAEFIASLERDKPDIQPPFGFNRIITPHNYNSQMFDFLNTEYVLSLDSIDSPKLKKVFEEGETKIYKNLGAYPRAFFVKDVSSANNSIRQIYSSDLKSTAIVEGLGSMTNLAIGEARITHYSESRIEISTYNKGNGFLVISDSFYPTWKVYIDGRKTTLYKTNHAFRGVYIPAGNHTILFKDGLL